MAGGGIKINNTKIIGGADGKTPVFKIENGKLYNSYANGKDGSWIELGQVKGNDGVDGKDGLAGAKLLSQELIGQDEQGGNIYKQTFSDGTEAYFTAPKGNDGVDGNGKGTTVTVGGVDQKTWNADSKLDKFTEATQFHQVYGKTNTGVQKRYNVSHYNYAGNIPIYEKATQALVGQQDDGGTIAVAIPLNPYQATPKQYVDDGLSGKVDKVTTVVGGFNLYGTKYNDPTTQMWQIDDGNASQSRIPMYFIADNASVSENGKGCLVTSTPKHNAHATNKKWVEDTVKLYKHLINFTISGFGSCFITALNHSATAIETLREIVYLINDGETLNILFSDAGTPQVIYYGGYATYQNNTLTIGGLGMDYSNNINVSVTLNESDVSSITDTVID